MPLQVWAEQSKGGKKRGGKRDTDDCSGLPGTVRGTVTCAGHGVSRTAAAMAPGTVGPAQAGAQSDWGRREAEAKERRARKTKAVHVRSTVQTLLIGRRRPLSVSGALNLTAHFALPA